MVRMVPDRMHGFGQRPHYEQRELNTMFEQLAVGFLSRKYGKAEFPFATEDLKTFIEQHVDDLDQYADLSPYGPGVEGLTEFRPGHGKPKVAISESLQGNENRQRTTLAHEFGHVHLHAYLFEMADRQMAALPANHNPNAIYCKRDTMLTAPAVDWREWQASFASSALLMPASYVHKTVAPLHEKHGIFGAVHQDSPQGRALIEAVAAQYRVSKDAARVRLSVLGLLGETSATPSLFS
ncbi:MAG TPA: ImmA/IrrE family metallo-endopeptidase [Hyphomicrobiaceae bacterium]|nr:ImmA/IrrE family metallo-endopeptidase [Hyphomicrobiaceae bacterium]